MPGPRPKSPEEFADQLGIRSALVVLCIAFLIAAMWFVSSPSFEKCSAVDNVTDRNACYDGLRMELLKPPAKGADIPRGQIPTSALGQKISMSRCDVRFPPKADGGPDACFLGGPRAPDFVRLVFHLSKANDRSAIPIANHVTLVTHGSRAKS